jgi:hypothetical protein
MTHISQPLAEPVRQPALWEDTVDLVIAPSSVFARRATQGALTSFVFAFGLFALLVLIGHGSLVPFLEAQTRMFLGTLPTTMSDADRVLASEALQLRQETYPVALVFRGALFILGTAVLVLVGLRVNGRQARLSQSVTIASLAFFPHVLAFVALWLQVTFTDVSAIEGRLHEFALGPARFLPVDAPKALVVLCRNAELADVWRTALIALGMRTAGLPVKRAIGTAMAIWMLTVGLDYLS